MSSIRPPIGSHPHDWVNWQWLTEKWNPIAYRTRQVILEVLREARWHPFGSGKDLTFRRMIDVESGSWPFDVEEIKVRFNYRGHLVRWERRKVIQIDRGRSHESLCKALGVPEVKR
ncbi:MAG: hypothetical protein KDB37_12855 [Ilumatobacter sp.]|nr:hypothetical protein [Ilumatobacter sp.]